LILSKKEEHELLKHTQTELRAMVELAGELGYDGDERIDKGALVLEVCCDARDLLRVEKRPGHHQRTARDEILRGSEAVNAGGECESDWRTGKRARRCKNSPGRCCSHGRARGGTTATKSMTSSSELETESVNLPAIGKLPGRFLA
jgi:hypothetical protein